ncbi:uncharacterized protein PFL1_04630 [Pseudozyma flocculosa PF-1]|uniref:Anaphase-promoting complex subunit 4 n=2 Tax=Pseudozyma flocculosa TaxID=84751 RepID=A0A5C3FDF8_9BASI|nr:uncharacterized protein PFL1_04630 [Pseudozyma flocculosa PF-1]EPQ27886.1 hypothetical protein PFL1_04630 [Pseudozyma flocculosa PF-1]SPO41667.1 uncharacterized protein PSFLO_07149 [Pseudozyma flocculosa]
MALPIEGGTWAEPGACLGLMPVLADHRLPKSATLLHSSANPRMDLVLLLTKDEAAAAATTAAGASANRGMSAAQRALMQRMMAKRAGQAAGPATAPEPTRGPKINMELWRLGDDSSCVWEVPLTAERLLDPEPGSAAAKAAEQELEDLCVHDIGWSPDGDRLAALFSVRRLKTAAAASEPSGRYVTLVRTFSVHDGRLCSTALLHPVRDIRTKRDAERFKAPHQLSWHPLDPPAEATEAAKKGQTASATAAKQLAKFDPLPPVPSADEFASGSSTANLMPHQLRMMQMSGAQKPQPSFELPSSMRASGRGPLASYPWLFKDGTELGLVERSDRGSGSGSGTGPSPRPADGANRDTAASDLAATSILCVANSKTSRIHLLLDASIHLGSFAACPAYRNDNLPHRYTTSHITTHVPRNLSTVIVGFTLDRIAGPKESKLSGEHVVSLRATEAKLPIKQSGKAHPKSSAHLMNKLSRLGHLLGIYAGYSLDVAAIIQQIWSREIQQGVIDEWTKLTKELQVKFGCDYKYELLNSLLTGKASPAVETLLLANLTEGLLTRFEQTAFAAFDRLKQLLHVSLRPALERILICLKEWQGLYRYFRLYNFGGLEDDAPQRESSNSGSTPSYGYTQTCSESSSNEEPALEAKRPDKSNRLPNKFIRVIQECLDTCLSLAELIDIESVTVEEFFRYCRYEKERQERLKQDQQEPRLAINYDVTTVARFLERGFEPPGIKRLLGSTPLASEIPAPDSAAAAGDATATDLAQQEVVVIDDSDDDDDLGDSEFDELEGGNSVLDVDDDMDDVEQRADAGEDAEVVESSALEAMLAQARAHLKKIEALVEAAGAKEGGAGAKGKKGKGKAPAKRAAAPAPPPPPPAPKRPRGRERVSQAPAFVSKPPSAMAAPSPPPQVASGSRDTSKRAGGSTRKTGLSTTSPTSPGLLDVLATVVRQMGQVLGDVLAESLSNVKIKSTYTASTRVFHGKIPIEDEAKGPIPKRPLTACDAIESLASVPAQQPEPAPRLLKVASAHGQDRVNSKDFTEYFVATCTRASYGLNPAGSDGAVAAGDNQPEFDRLIVWAWTPKMRTIEHQYLMFGFRSAHVFQGQAQGATILDYAYYDHRELVLLVRLPLSGAAAQPASAAASSASASGAGRGRGRKRKTRASDANGGSTDDGGGGGDDDDTAAARYFIATFWQDEHVRGLLFEEDYHPLEDVPLQLERVTELPTGFRAASMSMSERKKTVAVVNRQRNRIVYVDLTRDWQPAPIQTEHQVGRRG